MLTRFLLGDHPPEANQLFSEQRVYEDVTGGHSAAAYTRAVAQWIL
jgi:hypothetical protein